MPQRDIYVILDGVFNHTGADSIYFNKYNHYDSVGAYNSKSSPFYPWYNFYSYPDKYECWWGVDILPRVNCSCEGYREFILGENGVVKKYMRLGASGFRLELRTSFPTVLYQEYDRGKRGKSRRFDTGRSMGGCVK